MVILPFSYIFCSPKFFRLSFLEEDKYDFEVKHDFLKQELKQHRQRVNDLMGAKAKGKINTRKWISFKLLFVQSLRAIIYLYILKVSSNYLAGNILDMEEQRLSCLGVKKLLIGTA